MRTVFCFTRPGFRRYRSVGLSIILFIAIYVACSAHCNLFADEIKTRSVLIIYEGGGEAEIPGISDARQFSSLLGHFHANVTIKRMDNYLEGEMSGYDIVAFMGYNDKCTPPQAMMRDVYNRKKTFIWISSGIAAFNESFSSSLQYGFNPLYVEDETQFKIVKHNGDVFTREPNEIMATEITDASKCSVIATASSEEEEIPYILRSGNFWYVADDPFAWVSESNRYLLFADLLHDMLGENHPESHRALIRIEDIHPDYDPDLLRSVADLLYSEKVPFLISLIPFYVDPEKNIQVSLSERQEFVQAIHYMVQHGGTVAMHGVTHQYRGVTAYDYEFWDEEAGKPAKSATPEYVRKKLETGLNECIRNDIYPILWETPHYAASQTTYDAVGTIFSSAMEHRLSVDDEHYPQYFPYIINSDIHGQKIYPQNLGYVPFDPENPDVAAQAVTNILDYAKTNLAVRDGFASVFYHAFIPLKQLTRLVEGIKELGYSFADPKEESNTVILKDKAIVSGTGKVKLTLSDQYLRERYVGRDGTIEKQSVSANKINGEITREVSLRDGQIYVATPSETPETPPASPKVESYAGFLSRIQKAFGDVSTQQNESQGYRAAILWNPSAGKEASNDQCSLKNVFQCLGVEVDELGTGETGNLAGYNLLIAPYGSVAILNDSELNGIVNWVRTGGSCITDGTSKLSDMLGVVKTGTTIRVSALRDSLFPDEGLSWQVPEQMAGFSTKDEDSIFVAEEKTASPVVVGKKLERGKFIYFGCRFDPESDAGFSRFPHIAEYVRTFLNLSPFIARNALEIYFDPGFRNNVGIETLVKRWANLGVSVVHAASWHQYPQYTYDYKRLIALCHANGILVYAWMEPPQVSLKFWQDHPEWREKNVDNDDARPAWRYPVALTDERCFSEMSREFRMFLEGYDFDGVNFAEIYFESADNGPETPGAFTPMHPSARAEFEGLHGFDPALLMDRSSPRFWKNNPDAWQQFEDYRVDKAISVIDRLLKLAEDIRTKRPGFDVIVTALDSIDSPLLRRSQGIDTARIIELKKTHNFTLAVEDPQSRWSEDPRRYKEIADKYRVLQGNDVMLDLNILSFRSENDPTPFPTLRQTGTEAFSMVGTAGRYAGRFVLYSESSIDSKDFQLLAFAAAGVARTKRNESGFEISSPHSTTFHSGLMNKWIAVDGRLRKTGPDGQIMIPVGTHVVETKPVRKSMFSLNPMQTGIGSITGNLLDIEEDNRSVDFSYESAHRCLATATKAPVTIFVDNNEIPFQTMRGDNRFSVFLPPGKHHVHMTLLAPLSYGINLAGLWSSFMIAVFGVFSVMILSIFYISVRFMKGRKYE